MCLPTGREMVTRNVFSSNLNSKPFFLFRGICSAYNIKTFNNIFKESKYTNGFKAAFTHGTEHSMINKINGAGEVFGLDLVLDMNLKLENTDEMTAKRLAGVGDTFWLGINSNEEFFDIRQSAIELNTGQKYI